MLHIFHVIQHLPEVCSLSCRASLNPYPPYYRMAFAFSSILYPLIYRHPLRFAFHFVNGDNWAYHVPLILLDGLVSACLPENIRSREVTYDHFIHSPYHFGQGLSAPLAFSPSRHLSAVHICYTYHRL